FLPSTDIDDQLWIGRSNGLLAANEEGWIFNTNNRRELIVVLGLNHFQKNKIKEIARMAQQHFAFSGMPASVVVSEDITEISRLNEGFKGLHEILYKNIVIGKGTAIFCFEKMTSPDVEYELLSNSEEKQMTFAIEKKDWKWLKKMIGGWFEKWQHDQYPSIYVERNLKKILYGLKKNNIELDLMTSTSLERAVGEIVYTSTSFAEAGDAFWEVLTDALQGGEQDTSHESRGQLFHKIEHYLISNLSSPLSLTQLMDVFDVSSTYLCNLFRSFSGKSFVEYLTQLRIDKAKNLMLEHPELSLKDVAELVSYTDRHYFTKVFKAITGKTPSEYRNSLQT
ncbi:MAG TPA: AraC family transcriptional regulator, partial [Bacilli bacterium]